jgi:predicted nucleic acid-binding protein
LNGDPDDIELLALTLHMKIPLWTNDNDFERCGIERFTTAEILRKLGIFGAK